jgi:hypothetical protein
MSQSGREVHPRLGKPDVCLETRIFEEPFRSNRGEGMEHGWLRCTTIIRSLEPHKQGLDHLGRASASDFLNSRKYLGESPRVAFLQDKRYDPTEALRLVYEVSTHNVRDDAGEGIRASGDSAPIDHEIKTARQEYGVVASIGLSRYQSERCGTEIVLLVSWELIEDVVSV